MIAVDEHQIQRAILESRSGFKAGHLQRGNQMFPASQGDMVKKGAEQVVLFSDIKMSLHIG